MKVLLALCGLALLSVGIAYGQSASCDGYPRADVDCSGTVDSLDLLLVAQHIGEQWTPTTSPEDTPTSSLPTPSSTVTPTQAATGTTTPSSTGTTTGTPSLTPTPTSTSSPSPPQNSVAQILRDSDETTPHDGNICGTSGYDWEHTSAIQGVGPAGYPLATGWGVINWDCGQNVAGITVTIQNFTAWVLGSSWHQITDHIGWCEAMNPPTNAFAGNGCDLSGNWLMPNASQSIHWASDHNPVGDAVCILTMYQARQSGNAAIMGNAGADWWSGSSIRAGGVGRFHRLTTTFEWISFTTCTAAQLSLHPPPL